MVVQVKTQDQFKSMLKEQDKKLVVIDFFATWCGPCKAIAPQYQQLSETHTDVVFLKVDVDELDQVAAEYGVSAMPTFIFLKGGKKVAEVVGANIDNVKKAVESHK